MIDTVIRLLSFLVYIFLLNFFFSSWSVTSRLSIKRILILLGLASIVSLAAFFTSDSIEPFINILVTLIAMVTIASQYDVSKRDLFFWMVILLAINFISESISLAVFDALLSPQYDAKNLLFVIITTSITMTIEILIFLALKLIFFRHHLILESLSWPSLVALTSIPVISIIVLFSFLLAKVNVTIQSTYFVLLVALGVLYMNLCILYLYSSFTKQLRKLNQITLQNKSLSYELKYIANLKKSQVKLASIRHDLKNKLIVLRGLLEHSQINEAKAYLQESTDQLDVRQKFYTRDMILNYLLNDKHELARQANIKFEIKVLLSEQINVNKDILAVLIGNLIDNALEASKRLPNPTDAAVSLVIKQFQDKLLIDIKNHYNPEEAVTRRKRKSDGLGTRNIKRIVAKYNGLYKQWTEGSNYLVSIILLNVN
ncbi:sensor histidine kinase [Secundilactobacillus yichangensis]|uniref:sensor histidine kinase n=1 Tax=Secundilactobacillus yichangensis TaxID=2799580 RepID=UPI001943E016|nr:GHKL domain-containing protein [Secundilactobacillus yichangensis]